jgi:signal transduction histidine kinase
MSHPTADSPDLAALRARLESNRDSLPWHERLALAATLGRSLAGSTGGEDHLALIRLLADDTAPEVRKEVASALVHLPGASFTMLAAKLGEDQNAYVKHAAERAIARRMRTARETQRIRRELGAVESRVASFEGTYGPEATRKLRRIADDQFSSLVRQTDHDLRQILSPIKTSISSLNRQFDSQPDIRFCRDTLRDMGRRMVYLEQFLSDLREYAKAEPAERRRERLVEIIREAKGMAWSALRQSGSNPDRVVITIEVPEHLTVFVARHQVVLAMVHLIRNAVEAFEDPTSRRRKRHIEVLACVDGGSVTVTIADNACGIHPDDLDQLREFIPGKPSRKPNGTGFGLPTTARYIEAQGGTVTLDSHLGESTTVTMTLPIASEDEDL